MRAGWLLLVVTLVGAGCVDLARPSPHVSELDGPLDANRDRHLSEVAPPLDLGPDQPMPPPDADEPDAPGIDMSDPPEVPMEALPLANGRPCASGEQCRSGLCAQGVCCNTDCAQACQTCNLAGKEGQCQPVPAGEDPRDSCTREAPASCGHDGTCDGAGACRRYPTASECEAGRCAAGVEYAARTCDGAGTCRPVSSKACASGTCTGDTCAGPCSAGNPCQPGFYCDAGRCALTKPIGNTCTEGTQCSSGFCVDGYCCTSMCAETCFACNVATKLGTCTSVPSGQDPRAQCPAQAATTCGRAGGCNGTGACRLHPAGTTCGPTGCTAGIETLAPTCDGISVCRPPAGTRDCAPFACGDSACATSCLDAASCAPGFSCQNSTCVRSPGLALFYRLEDIGTTTVSDSSGNGRDGTLDGNTGAPVSSGVVPTLMYPNARSRAFTLPSRHAIKIDPIPVPLRFTNNFSLALWYRSTQLDSNGGSDIGSELVSGANGYVLRLRPGNQVEFSKRQSGTPLQCKSSSVPTYLDGKWHHVAATASSTTGVKVYFDGVEVCSDGSTTDVNWSGGTLIGSGFWLGRHGGAPASVETQWDFSGNMDEVRVYSRVLTAQEITALAQGRNN